MEPERFDWTNFWNLKARSPTDFQATGRSSMDIHGFLAIIRQIVKHLDLAPQDRLLDIGCGTGIVALALAPWLTSIYGVDISSVAVNRAKKNCAELDNVQFRVASITELPTEIGMFSKVCGYSVLQYLQDEMAILEAFRAIGSIMPPGSRAYMAANQDPKRKNNYIDPEITNNMSSTSRDEFLSIANATLWVSPERMLELSTQVGLRGEILAIPKQIWQHFYMFDLLLHKDP